MDGTESRISVLVSNGTQTDTVSSLHNVNFSVTIPFMEYVTLTAAFYERQYRSVASRDTNSNDLTGCTNVQGQAAPASSTFASVGTITNNNLGSPLLLSMDSTMAGENVKKDTEKSTTKVKSSKSEILIDPPNTDMSSCSTKCSSTSSKSSSTKTSYGNQMNFNCCVRISRLSVDDIRKACYPLGDLPKIRFKTCSKKLNEDEKIEQSTENNTRSRILTSHLVDTTRRKSTMEQIKNAKSSSSTPSPASSSSNSSNSISKRKSSPDHLHEKTTNKANNDRREMVQALARTFESLVDTDPTLDSIESQDDLKNWCLTKVMRTMEQHPSKKT